MSLRSRLRRLEDSGRGSSDPRRYPYLERQLRAECDRLALENGLDPVEVWADAQAIISEVEKKYGGDLGAWIVDEARNNGLSYEEFRKLGF